MTQKTYARISSGAVMEIVSTDADIAALYHPSIRWADITGKSVHIGDLATASGFNPPPAPVAPAPAPSIADLQAQLTSLRARLAALETPPASH